MSDRLQFFANRIAAGLVAALVGFFLVLLVRRWMLRTSDTYGGMILVGVPLACGLLGLILGDRFLDFLKRITGLDN